VRRIVRQVAIKFNDSLEFLPFILILAGAVRLFAIKQHDSVLRLRICQPREKVSPHVFPPFCQEGAKALSESKPKACSLRYRCYRSVFKTFFVLATYFWVFYILVSEE
jgi:hypothetical protein